MAQQPHTTLPGRRALFKTMKISRFIIAAATMAATAVPLMHAEEVDLQLQRREDQTVNAVPGHKLVHEDFVINPTPRSIVRDDRRPYLDIAPEKLTVKSAVGEKAARKAGVKPVEGAYSLVIDGKGARITAYDKAGEFYARQTLRSILEGESARNGRIPRLTVNDWPELPVRGLVEGFYGTPWTHQARMQLIDLFGRNKLNRYIYGPKNDPYHTSPDWRKPYPDAEAAQLRELIAKCDSNMVRFCWAVHPGSDIRWTDTDFNDLMAKFNQLYSLGCRSFAIFFDDIKGEGTDPHKQVSFLNRLTEDFVKAKGDVTPLVMCPTDFTRAWADGSPTGPLAVYGQSLDPSVSVMWTGDAVCGDIPKSTLDWVNTRTRRPALVWWNYPVTDYARHICNQGPVYGLDTANTATDLTGLLSNPMEYAIASSVAFYGVADYTWNPAAYNPLDNWERALAYLMPECPQAYRTFAINSCDTEFGYRRSESWETNTFPFSEYTPEKAAPLRAQLAGMKAAPAEIRAKCSDTLLLREIDPWLTQLQALAQRTDKALELMETCASGNARAFWDGYIANRMDSARTAAYEAHKVGTLKWQPFYEELMDRMVDRFYRDIAGSPSSIPEVIGTFGNIQSPSRKKMFDGDSTTVYFADRVQQPGDFIGIALPEPTPLTDIHILQGRDHNDVVLFDDCALEYSLDGNEWTTLLDSLRWQREISWTLPQGTDAPSARYVRLKKYPSDLQQGVGIREFSVNSRGVTPELDRNPSTSRPIGGHLAYTPAKGTRALRLLLGDLNGTSVTCRQLDADGTPLQSCDITGSYAEIPLHPKAATVELAGDTEIFEIIPTADTAD